MGCAAPPLRADVKWARSMTVSVPWVSAANRWIADARDSAFIAVAAAAVALTFNATRSRGIELVRRQPYDILVPCTEAGGEVTDIPADAALISDRSSLLIDARSQAQFAQGHLPAAINIPFDYLAPTCDAQVRKVASSRAARVLVYGDGEDPDCGRELGRELSSKGVRNVMVIRGGAPALANRLSEPFKP
jgi:hypothetical protein